MHDLESIRLNFNQDALAGLNIALAFIMFGIALSIKKSDFKEIVERPKAAFIGLLSQYILLPVFTFLLVWLLKPHPAISLGMILIAACPGGNVSNFFTYLSKGNVALSVGLSAVSTLAAFILTPLQLQFWGSILPETNQILKTISLSFFDLFKVVSTILLIPLVLGMLFTQWKPNWSAKIQKPVKVLSFVILLAIIGGGLSINLPLFKEYYNEVVYLVFVHNGIALLGAFFLGTISGIGRASVKTVTIETGIQNSGLGLVLIFNFFDGNGAMAIITAWWGIWHIIAGFTVSQLFKRYYPS